jgi:hypothetical protein
MCASNSNVAIALYIGPKVYDTCPSFKLQTHQADRDRLPRSQPPRRFSAP